MSFDHAPLLSVQWVHGRDGHDVPLVAVKDCRYEDVEYRREGTVIGKRSNAKRKNSSTGCVDCLVREGPSNSVVCIM